MKIRGWNIERFGIFTDYSVENLPGEMSVFLGPNEAGKSTLLGFLRGVLFGFPTGNVKEPKYPPAAGGSPAGAVTIETPDEGSILIRREGPRKVQIRKSDGSMLTDGELRHLLGGVERSLFQRVFAFSLWDMQSIETLDEKGVQERICSAAITGSGRSPTAVIDDLKIEIKAKNTEAVNINTQLKALKSKLRTAVDGAAHYSSLVGEEEKWARVLEESTIREGELRSRRDWLERLQSQWPACSRRQRAEEALSKLQPVDAFPPDPEARMANARQAMEAADKELKDTQQKIKDREGEANSLKALLRNDISAVTSAVHEQCETAGIFRKNLSDIVAAGVRFSDVKTDADNAMRQPGTDWDVARVEVFDTSSPVRDAVNQWKERFEKAARQLDNSESDAQAARRQCAKETSDRDRIKNELEDKERPDESDLRAREDALDKLESLRKNLNGFRNECESHVRLLEQIEKNRAERLAAMKTSFPLLAGIIAAVALGAAAWRISLSDIFGFVSSLILAAGAGWAAYYLYRAKKSGAAEFDLELLKERNLIEDASGQVSDTETEIRRYAAAAGLSGLVSEDEITAARNQLKEKERVLSDIQNIEGRLRDADERWQSAKKDLELAEEAAKTERKNYQNLDEEWIEWKKSRGLARDLSPEGTLSLIRDVRTAAEKIGAMKVADDALRVLESEVDVWQRRTKELLKSAGIAVSEEADENKLLDALFSLRDACIEEGEKQKQMKTLLGKIEELRQEEKQRAADVEAASDRLEDLLREGGVETVPQFEQRLQVVREREALQNVISAAAQSIDDAVGRGDDAERFRAELETGQVDAWRWASEELDNETGRIRQERDSAIRSHNAACTARKEIEAACDIPGIELEKNRLQCDLEKVLNEWRVKSLAKCIIEKTLKKYVRETQPAVLESAGDMMKKITGGRYVRIEQNPDSGKLDIQIIDSKSKPRKPEQLSRGTAEQLYLSLRLALVDEFARQQCSLPLVMDDVLVNFDPIRAGAVADILAGFAAGHQVLLFTCQPATVELLQKAGGEKVLVHEIPVPV